MRPWWIIALLTGCAAAPAPPPSPEPAPTPAPAPAPVVEEEEPFVCPEERGLCFSVTPPSAELIVDDVNHGRLEEIGRDGQFFIGLDAGIYQVTLRADGYETWRAEVSVREGVERIEVSLTPQE